MHLEPGLHPDTLMTMVRTALYFLAYLAAGLLPACGLIYLTYFLLTLPLRRNERARLFLDLLELGLKEGRTPERAVLEAAAARDTAPGARFYLLATHLETGVKLGEGLARAPRLLPPQLAVMLKTGERIGDIAKVLPACRQFLNDGVSQVRGALNYLLVLGFAVTPLAVATPILINVFILPRFREVFAEMSAGVALPAFTRFVFENSRGVMFIQITLLLLIWLLLLAYVGGPRLRGWIGRLLPGIPDRLLYCLPWRRKRLQRDFSAMLSVLLDAEVPEIEAVALAAECTANGVVRRRADSVCRLLHSGVKLTTAIRSLEGSGELQWRLANALQRGGGFLRALAGWHDALDARAFQLEQAAAQIATSALVILNGFIVAGVVLAIFLPLIQLVHLAVLW